ncbi:hypothetical protein [Streptomyces sp. EKS3.2]|uniref:hypothetical protein n=1 Tax=Streptomyces sp. EKS3.2 TaxID=3461008 RepID=UPI0040413AE4
MSQDLQHQLHSRLELATQMLDLPLTGEHLERLAGELTPAIKAILAEQAAALTDNAPVTYAVAAPRLADVAVSEYAGCTSRIGPDVDHESPAALLAARFRRQPDVVATDVPSATYVGLTVRPNSVHAWRWWLDKLNVAAEAVTVRGNSAYATGVVDGVVVELQGDEVPMLLIDEPAARLMGLLAESGPAPV